MGLANIDNTYLWVMAAIPFLIVFALAVYLFSGNVAYALIAILRKMRGR